MKKIINLVEIKIKTSENNNWGFLYKKVKHETIRKIVDFVKNELENDKQN